MPLSILFLYNLPLGFLFEEIGEVLAAATRARQPGFVDVEDAEEEVAISGSEAVGEVSVEGGGISEACDTVSVGAAFENEVLPRLRVPEEA